MGKLDGKTCLITGAGKGIGKAIALAFAREGARVAIADIDAELAGAAADEIAALGGGRIAIVCDVADEAQVAAMVADAERQLGQIDILFNNAGILHSELVQDMSVANWDRMIAVNLRGVFLATRAVLPGMLARKSGKIINMSSQLAHKGSVTFAHYAAAKAGLLGFTKSLAQEVIGQGINVNALCPGPIDTEMTRANPPEWNARKMAELPIKRFGRIDEITPSAVLLASDDGNFYVGATLNPNGGDVMI